MTEVLTCCAGQEKGTASTFYFVFDLKGRGGSSGGGSGRAQVSVGKSAGFMTCLGMEAEVWGYGPQHLWYS